MSARVVERRVTRPLPSGFGLVGRPISVTHRLIRFAEYERYAAAGAYAKARGWNEDNISPEAEEEAFGVADGAALLSDGSLSDRAEGGR
jgi:hypothetical protein